MSWALNYITELQAGTTVSFRPRGNSMTPKIKSGQLCTVRPYDVTEDLEKGEVVLCKVRGKVYLHRVAAVRGDEYQIANNHGHINGWCKREKVYGVLVEVTD